MTATSFYDANRTNAIVLCTVELGPTVTESELSLLRLDVCLTHNGIPWPIVREENGTTFTYITVVRSFQEYDHGDYVCTASLSLLSPSPYVTGNGTLTGVAAVSTGRWANTPPVLLVHAHHLDIYTNGTAHISLF